MIVVTILMRRIRGVTLPVYLTSSLATMEDVFPKRSSAMGMKIVMMEPTKLIVHLLHHSLAVLKASLNVTTAYALRITNAATVSLTVTMNPTKKTARLATAISSSGSVIMAFA